MKHRKRKSRALAALLLVLVCGLSACSLSFCGISPGGRKELRFICNEELPAKEQADAAAGSKEKALADNAEAGTDSGAVIDSGSGTDPSSGAVSTGRVNINSAGVEELMTLKGVGETRAKAIIEYREKNGPFQKIEDIMQIPGIKEGIFSKIKEQIAVQ